MEGGKVTKWGEDLFFFFFFFSLFKTTEICFGSTKMGIFYQEKVFHARKKIRKNDFAPSEKYSSYAHVWVGGVVHYIHNMWSSITNQL